MRICKSIGFGFASTVALALALIGFAASASDQPTAIRTALSGIVQGGLSGVSGARVTLYAAGTAYGANPTSLGRTTTDSSGNFTVRYTSPAAPTILYLVALGGNAGAGTNTAIGLMGVAGMSNALPASVTINELTTVAAEWALAQFIDATGQIIGAPASNAIGLVNAANQAQANLADIATGAPASFWSNQGVTESSCTGGSPPVNCDGLERLDTIANILAACVEGAARSSQCTTLGGPAGSGVTTLGAAHHMATNPFANAALFALQSSSSRFTPVLSAFDGWEVALNFAPSSAFNLPLGVAIDAAGNVWVPNDNGNNVTELNPSGGLVGNFDPIGANFNAPDGVAIDAVGNVWVTNFYGNSVTELTSSGGLAANFNNINTGGANFANPDGVEIDATGNAWVLNSILDSGSVTELTSNGGLVGNFDPNGANFSDSNDVGIDAAGNVWMTNNLANVNSRGSVTELTSSGGLAGNFNNTNTRGAHFNGPSGGAIDATGNVWVTNAGSFANPQTSVTEVTSSGGLIGNFAPIGANFKTPIRVAIDAAGNVWVANINGNRNYIARI